MPFLPGTPFRRPLTLEIDHAPALVALPDHRIEIGANLAQVDAELENRGGDQDSVPAKRGEDQPEQGTAEPERVGNPHFFFLQQAVGRA